MTLVTIGSVPLVAGLVSRTEGLVVLAPGEIPRAFVPRGLELCDSFDLISRHDYLL